MSLLSQDAEAIANNIWLPRMSQMLVHGVNVGAAMENWALMYRYTNESAWLTRGRAAWDKLARLHGQPTGVLSADEGLAGTRPDRGTETCAALGARACRGQSRLPAAEISTSSYFSVEAESVSSRRNKYELVLTVETGCAETP